MSTAGAHASDPLPESSSENMLPLLQCERDEDEARERRLAALQSRSPLQGDVHVYTQRRMESLKRTSVKSLGCADVVLLVFRWSRLVLGAALLALAIVAGDSETWVVGSIRAWHWLAWAAVTVLTSSALSLLLVQTTLVQSATLRCSPMAAFYLQSSSASLALLLWSLAMLVAWLLLVSPYLDYGDATLASVNFYALRAIGAIVVGAVLAVAVGMASAWVSAHHERVSYVDKIIAALRTSYLIVRYLTPPDLLGTTVVDRYARTDPDTLAADPFALAECIAFFRSSHFSIAERRTRRLCAGRERQVLVDHEIFDDEVDFLADVIMAHLSQAHERVTSDIAERFFAKLRARESSKRGTHALESARIEFDFDLELAKDAFVQRVVALAGDIPAEQWTAEERADGLADVIQSDVEGLWDDLFGDASQPPALSRARLDRALKSVFEARFDLRVALLDAHAAVQSVSNFLAGAALCAWAMILVLLFAGDANSYNVWVGITGFFVALAVVLGPTLQSLFANIVFLFVRHPMDVGDLVVLDGDWFEVERMELVSTTLRRWDGLVQQRSNASLAEAAISNLSRTREYWQSVKFSVDVPCVRGAFLRRARDWVDSYVAQHPRSFTGAFQLSVTGMADPLQAALQLDVELRYSRERSLASIFDDITRCHVLVAEVLALSKATRSGVGAGALVMHAGDAPFMQSCAVAAAAGLL